MFGQFISLPLPTVTPFGTILFDFLYLLLAIAVEAYFLNSRLSFDKKTSILYAVGMNCFSKVIGWTIFFLLIYSKLPIEGLKLSILQFVFFNRIEPSMYYSVFFWSVIIFMVTLFLKLYILKLLVQLLNEEKKVAEPEIITRRINNRRGSQTLTRESRDLFLTVLLANAISYTVISFVIAAIQFNVFLSLFGA
jgi:hypothetical protein